MTYVMMPYAMFNQFVKKHKKNKTNDEIYRKLRNKNQKNIFGLEKTPFYINYMPNKNYITKWNKIFSLFETLPATIGTNKFILKEREWSIKKHTSWIFTKRSSH